MKEYDERYFQRWYRNPRSRVVATAERERRISMAVGAAEFILERRLRSVLDVGCGEAPWYTVLRRMRPRISYLGIDSSDYAVRRFGKRRNIIHGTFAALDYAAPDRSFDLVIASDVIHYLSKPELERGLPALVRRTGGLAYLDFFTSMDRVEGDMRDMKLRSPGYYLKLLRSHGLHPLGLQLYGSKDVVRQLASLERLAGST